MATYCYNKFKTKRALHPLDKKSVPGFTKIIFYPQACATRTFGGSESNSCCACFFFYYFFFVNRRVTSCERSFSHSFFYPFFALETLLGLDPMARAFYFRERERLVVWEMYRLFILMLSERKGKRF